MPAEGRWATWRPLLLALALAGGILAVSVVMATFPVVQRWSGDVRLYEHYASLALSGSIGNTPFLDWYPPLALVPLSIPLLVGTGPMYASALGAEMAMVAGAGALLLHRFGSRLGADGRAFPAYALLIVVATALFAWRYDAVPAIVVLGALVAVSTGHWAVAGAALGFATGLKLYAILLAPLFVLWAWRRGGANAGGRVAGFAVGAGVLSAAAYLLFPGASPLDLLAFTAARPLHVESVPGAAIAFLASVGIGEAHLAFGSGSFNVVGPASDTAIGVLRLMQPLLLLVATVAGFAAIAREIRPSEILLITASLAVLLALLISNRVLSPQYLIWLLPLVPLVGGWLRGLLMAAILLTALVFPWLYSSLVALEPVPLLLVMVRNGVLIAAFALAVRHVVAVGQRRIMAVSGAG